MMMNPSVREPIETYKEACLLMEKLGMLPLAPLLPDHPSLTAVTPEENWHTGSGTDPWQWRVRFPSEGDAAYGKFFRKKAVLVHRDWYPLLHAALGGAEDLRERYTRGLLSREALVLYEIIRDHPGIETRELRSVSGMKAKEQKNAFDRGLAELQERGAIVISGAVQRLDASGEKSGWNSTSYETSENWMRQSGLARYVGNREEARLRLLEQAERIWSPAAVRWLSKELSR